VGDFLHVPKRLRNTTSSGHDHTAGLILPASAAGAKHAVPEAWADSPPPRLPDKVQAFVVGVDDAKQSRVHNVYVCDAAGCGVAFHTLDRHPGVTPVNMAHTIFQPGTRCPGRCLSAGYPTGRVPADLGDPSHEWYRPSAEVLDTATPRVVEHVMRGGLLLRRWMG
jgi:hypothetical protein